MKCAKNKELSWEKFNNDDDEKDSEGYNEIEHEGLILRPMSSMSHNVNEYEDFNFYIGHCNFYVNPEIVNFLAGVDGVESLDILSPYRFRISIGKLFEPKQILNHISHTLTGSNENNIHE